MAPPLCFLRAGDDPAPPQGDLKVAPTPTTWVRALPTPRHGARLVLVPKLLIATTNPGKIAELRGLLEGCGWDVVTPADIGIAIDVEEDGETYHDNARIKALAGVQASGLVTLADDSGIEIQAMGGEPGVP